MRFQTQTQNMTKKSILESNKVLKNTYMLLSLTLGFSALTSYLTVAAGIPGPGLIITLIGMFGLSALTSALRNSAMGIVAVFAFTGFMGYVMGPIVSMYMSTFSNGAQLVYTALGATGLTFFALSAYVMSTGKNFNFLGGIIFAGMTIAFLMVLVGLFFNIGIFFLIIDGIIALMSAASILYKTSEIINGGERNYIVATVGLYCSLFNLFLSLLRILSFFSGNRD